jgi:hypothetical protein
VGRSHVILGTVVTVLLSITFACGLLIAIAHVINKRFIAPVYDVVANLVAFASASAASSLLGHWIPAALSAGAFLCWIFLARRTRNAKSGSNCASTVAATKDSVKIDPPRN